MIESQKAKVPLRGYRNFSNLYIERPEPKSPEKKKKFFDEFVVDSTPRKSYTEYRKQGQYEKFGGHDEDDFYLPNTGID